jgi:hypothetical protein
MVIWPRPLAGSRQASAGSELDARAQRDRLDIGIKGRGVNDYVAHNVFGTDKDVGRPQIINAKAVEKAVAIVFVAIVGPGCGRGTDQTLDKNIARGIASARLEVDQGVEVVFGIFAGADRFHFDDMAFGLDQFRTKNPRAGRVVIADDHTGHFTATVIFGQGMVGLKPGCIRDGDTAIGPGPNACILRLRGCADEAGEGCDGGANGLQHGEGFLEVARIVPRSP